MGEAPLKTDPGTSTPSSKSATCDPAFPPEPQKEEEKPFCDTDDARRRSFGWSQYPMFPYPTEPLPAKDSKAISLTIGCIFALGVIWLVNYIWPKQDTLTSQLFDVLKYVITTSLGYFFWVSNKK